MQGRTQVVSASASLPPSCPPGRVWGLNQLLLVLVCPAGAGDITAFALGEVTWAHRPRKAEQGAGSALGFRQNENVSKPEM